jgi:hypothetical protein
MKLKIFKISIYIILFTGIVSCSQKEFILKGNTYRPREIDKTIAIDSIKITEVYDNRLKKDSIIGFRIDENQPVILKRDLTEYLKMMFNSIMVTDSSRKDYVPVKITVNEFYSYNWNSNNDYKYNFEFEYPIRGENKKIWIMDSNVVYSSPDFKDQVGAIYVGLRRVASMFKAKYLSSLTSDTLKININHKQDSVASIMYFDTLDMTKKKIIHLDRKFGISSDYFLGINSLTNYSISLSAYSKFPNSSWEYKLNLGYQYNEIMKNNKFGNIKSFAINRDNRYKIFKDLDGFFINYSYGVLIGYESYQEKEGGYVFGIKLKETIGYNLFDYFDIETGLYQQAFYSMSRLAPYDIGVIFKVSLSNGY